MISENAKDIDQVQTLDPKESGTSRSEVAIEDVKSLEYFYDEEADIKECYRWKRQCSVRGPMDRSLLQFNSDCLLNLINTFI